MLKRIMALLLSLTMVFTAVPWAAMAAETETDATVQTNDITVEGTNGFGSLLSAEIVEAQEENVEAYEGGYSVTDLVIEGNAATVTYDALGEANLVVALYTEDGMQLLTSANTLVSPEETEATVTFADTMPEYFLASAYLVDTYDFSPLCESYDTPMYTKDMQDLLASTVEDYDADRVLQLTEDTTTNFAVYAESVIRIEYAEGVNTVASADDENLIYVIENADEQITGLTAGDVFAYSYAENEMLIVKVGSISVDGTTVTITGDDSLSIAEAFQAVKIETESDTDDIIVDDSTASDKVQYMGNMDSGSDSGTFSRPVEDASTFAYEGGDTTTAKKEFRFFDESLKEDDGSTSASFSVSGSLKIKMDVTVKYYVSASSQYVEFKVAPSLEYSMTVKGSVTFYEDLGFFYTFPVPGIYVGFNPQIQLKLNCNATFTASLNAFVVGFKYDDKSGFQNISQKPNIDCKLNVQGTVFLGINLRPQVVLLEDGIAEISATMLVGGELTFTAKGYAYEAYKKDADSHHQCRECLDIDIKIKAEIGGELKILNQEWLTLKITIGQWTIPLGKAYWSLDSDTFDFGQCPNYTYRVTVEVSDKDGNPVSGISVDVDVLEEPIVTNGNGIATCYLAAGRAGFYAEQDGYYDSTYVIIDEARKVLLIMWEAVGSGSGSGTEDSDSGDWRDTIDFGGVDDYRDDSSSTDSPESQTGIADGIYIIWESTHNTAAAALSQDASYGYLPYINVSVKDNVLMGYDKTALWTFTNVIGNQFSIMDIYGRYLYLSGTYCSFDVSSEIPPSGYLWYALENEDGCFFIVNVDKNKLLAFDTTYSSFGAWEEGDDTRLSALTLTAYVEPDDTEEPEVSYATKMTALPNNGDTIIIYNSGNAMGSAASGSRLAGVAAEVTDNQLPISEDMAQLLVTIDDAGNYIFTLDGKYLTSAETGNGLSFAETLTDCGKWTAEAATDGTWYLHNVGANYNGNYNQAMEYYSSGFTTYGIKELAIYQMQLYLVSSVSALIVNNNAPTLDAVYGGEYSTEETETYTLKKATFSGLVPGEEYLLLAMASIDVESPIDPENLLYIDQAAAGEDGTLTFTYVQRVTTDPSYVVACGAATKTLADAEITFPEMIADGELHAVDPTVVYDGVTLQEGRDYEITGTVSYTEAGTYVCYIRGIHNYTGTMKCTYTVAEPAGPAEPGEPTPDGVTRIAGADRIATSLMLADQLKEVLGVEKFGSVVVASALNFPDALTGSYLAAVKDAPILLTYPAAHGKIMEYIANNLADRGTVYILGGESAVDKDFENMVTAKGLNAKRVAGSDRFGTNLAIMQEAGNYAEKPVLIATALNFADSLSASAAGLPMVLVYGSLRPEQKAFLETTSRTFIIIGGTSAVSAELEAELKAIGNVERLAGAGRYQTSVMVAEAFVPNPDAVVLAYARNFPDGLCGGPLAYALNAPLILTDNYDPSAADTYVDGIAAGIVVGGTGLISDAAARAIFDLAANTPITAK